MKNIIKLTTIFLCLLSISTLAQEKILSKKEINKFQINKSKYIGKTVKFLLDDLKLPIISAQFLEANDSPNIIVLRFNKKEEYLQMIGKKSNVKPGKILILIKENDVMTNKMFQQKNNDSISKLIVRNNILEKNDDLLNNFLNLTILNIISTSEK